MTIVRCPVCNKKFDSAQGEDTLPFCSARCRQIDLGRWLGEGYAVPHERLDEEEHEALPDESVD